MGLTVIASVQYNSFDMIENIGIKCLTIPEFSNYTHNASRFYIIGSYSYTVFHQRQVLYVLPIILQEKTFHFFLIEKAI